MGSDVSGARADTSRAHNDANSLVMVLDNPGELEAVQTPRHLHVSKDHADVTSPLKHDKRVVCGWRFDDLETGLLQDVDRERTNERFILHDEDDDAV